MPAASRRLRIPAAARHGRGALRALLADPAAACRVYAPVGGHAICWLIWCGGCWRTAPIRRSSRSPPIRRCRSPKSCKRPQSWIGDPAHARDIRRFRCRANFMRRSGRIPPASNSATAQASRRCSPKSALRRKSADAAPLIDGVARRGPRARRAFADRRRARSAPCRKATTRSSMRPWLRRGGLCRWDATPVADARRACSRAGDLIEQNRGRLIALLQSEGGKTLDDAVAEVREAVDYLPLLCGEGHDAFAPRGAAGADRREQRAALPRPRRRSSASARGIFRSRSSLGQVTAALAAGNAVVAKPAEQTPLIAVEAVRLLHAAGVPASALHLVPGDGKVGAAARGRPPCRRRRLHRLDRSGAHHQSRARGQGRADRAADRRDRRHQCR